MVVLARSQRYGPYAIAGHFSGELGIGGAKDRRQSVSQSVNEAD
jgi:hypothetical protein